MRKRKYRPAKSTFLSGPLRICRQKGRTDGRNKNLFFQKKQPYWTAPARGIKGQETGQRSRAGQVWARPATGIQASIYPNMSVRGCETTDRHVFPRIPGAFLPGRKHPPLSKP
ncbi:MAG: hypothetical protein LBJ01_10690 [Tannerella sp.]|nr:hypothetical protein [Tannerella sp.]